MAPYADGPEACRQPARQQRPGAGEHQRCRGPEHQRLRRQEGNGRHPLQLRLSQRLHLDQEWPVPGGLAKHTGEAEHHGDAGGEPGPARLQLTP